jgi:hypothetical protein
MTFRVVVNETKLQFFRDPDSCSRAPPEAVEFFAGAQLTTAP